MAALDKKSPAARPGLPALSLVSEVHSALDTPYSGFVDKAGEVAEVDEAFDVLFVSDISTKQRDFPIAVKIPVANLQAAFEHTVEVEFDRLIQWHDALTLEYPVGEDEYLAIGAHGRSPAS